MIRLKCVACGQEIPQDRVVGFVAYCECGASHKLSNQVAKSETRRASGAMVIITVFMIAGALHAVNWDTYFFTIIPLKMKQLGGFATAPELQDIARICEARKKKNCVVEALQRAFDLDKKNVQGLLRVAEIYSEMKEPLAASRIYGLYFQHGGREVGARFGYARALAEAGFYKDAKKQFGYILKSDRDQSQFQVARSYVELLLKNKDYVTAKNIIEEYRRAGSTSALFLEKELKTIYQALGQARPKG